MIVVNLPAPVRLAVFVATNEHNVASEKADVLSMQLAVAESRPLNQSPYIIENQPAPV